MKAIKLKEFYKKQENRRKRLQSRPGRTPGTSK